MMKKDIRIECCENGWVAQSWEQIETDNAAAIEGQQKHLVFTDSADVLAFVKEFIGD